MNISIYNVKQNKAQQTEFEEILKEFKDISVDNVNVLVRHNEGNYIVWLDCDNEVDWKTTENFNGRNEENINKYIYKIGVLQHQPIAHHLSTQQYIDFNYMLAETVVLILENELEEADKNICDIKQYLKNRNCEITRKWQLISCFTILVVILFLFSLFKHNYEIVSEFLDISDDTINMMIYSVLGTIGATLSIIQKSGKKCYGCESGKVLNFLEMLSRMLASIISSFIVIYLYKSDMIFANFRLSQNSSYCLILICIIAGFSERLVPSIISKFENNELKEECCDD